MKRRFDSLPSEWTAFIESKEENMNANTDNENAEETSDVDNIALPLDDQPELDNVEDLLQADGTVDDYNKESLANSFVPIPDSGTAQVFFSENSQNEENSMVENNQSENYYYFVEEDGDHMDEVDQIENEVPLLPPGCLPEDMPSPLPVAPHHLKNQSDNSVDMENEKIEALIPPDEIDVPLPVDNDDSSKYLHVPFSNQSHNLPHSYMDLGVPLPPDPRILENIMNIPPPPPPEPDEGESRNKSPQKSKVYLNDLVPLPKEKKLSKINAGLFAMPAQPAEEPSEEKPVNDRYSPSRTESDDENQDSVLSKPKVLGKEQAKKRLMAFSMAKQAASPTKKQSKADVSKNNKDKPPNPNKSAGVQQQFRATVSAIEEEKKKMLKTMPNYLITDKLMNFATIGSMYPEKSSKSETAETDLTKKDSSPGRSSSRRKERNFRKRSSERKRSRSRSKKPSDSRSRKQSRSRSKGRSDSRSSSRVKKPERDRKDRLDRPDRSERSDRPDRPERSDRPERPDRLDRPKDAKDSNDKKSGKREDTTAISKIKELPKDWNSFSAAGLSPGSMFRRLKIDIGDKNKRREEPRRRYANDVAEYKPTFNYLKQQKPMITLVADRVKPEDTPEIPKRKRKKDEIEEPLEFEEQLIKYTLGKPTVIWSENVNQHVPFYMKRKMLLDNCGKDSIPLLTCIMDNKVKGLGAQEPLKEQSWFPQHEYLLPIDVRAKSEPKISPRDKNKEHSDSKSSKKNSSSDLKTEKKEIKRERKISLVDDNYLSDTENKEVKVHVDPESKSVKVRSRWDSDYEVEDGEIPEKSSIEEDMEISTPDEQETEVPIEVEERTPEMEPVISIFEEKIEEPFELMKTDDVSGKIFPGLRFEPNESTPLEATTGKLVLEYEEFMKMVEPSPAVDELKMSSPVEENKVFETPEKIKKSEPTEWEEESDHKEKPAKIKSKQVEKSSSEDLDSSAKSSSKKVVKKNIKKKTKIEKIKKKKPKVSKKLSKKKKKESSSESESEWSPSESESSSSDEDKKKKKTKKKLSKKKKSKTESFSESESDSSDDKTKKKRKKSSKLKKKDVKTKGKKKQLDESLEEAESKELEAKKQQLIKEINMMKKKKDKGKKRDRSKSSDAEEKSGKKRKVDEKIKPEKNKKKTKAKLKAEGKVTKKSRKESVSDEETSKKKKKKLKKKHESSSSSSSESDVDEEIIVPKSKSDLDEKKKRHSGGKTKTETVKVKKEEKKKKKKKLSESESEKEIKTKKKIKNKKKKRRKSTSESSEEEEIPKENLADFGVSFAEDESVWKSQSKRTVICSSNVDWEASSSEEEVPERKSDTESSWSEKSPKSFKIEKPKEKVEPVKKIEAVEKIKEEFFKDISNNSQTSHKSEEKIVTPFLGFVSNENSYHSISQELSKELAKDIFNAERSLSNSLPVKENNTAVVSERPFKSISQIEEKKPAESEIYSPGHTDSEASNEAVPEEKVPSLENEKKDVYDPLNLDSGSSADNNEKPNSIAEPLETDFDIAPKEPTPPPARPPSPKFINSFSTVSPVRTPIALSNIPSASPSCSEAAESQDIPMKKLISVKIQPPKAPNLLYVDDLDEKDEKDKKQEDDKKKADDRKKDKYDDDRKGERRRSRERDRYSDGRKRYPDRGRDDSRDRKRRRSRSRSKERRDSKRRISPLRRPRSKSPIEKPKIEEKPKEIKGTEFDVEPLKDVASVQPIPVLTGLDASHPGPALDWEKEHVDDSKNISSADYMVTGGYKPQTTEKDRKERRSRSRSSSPRKKYDRRRSRTPEKRLRSPRRSSRSPPRKRGRSPSPRRKLSPRRKSRSSRSPERRRRSRSRSPRKKRRSRSLSPRRRSPRRGDSPRRRDSPRRSVSPKRDPYYSVPRNIIPVIGGGLDVSPSTTRSPRFESPMGFSRSLADSTISDSELNNPYYNREYPVDYHPGNYPDEISSNNLITIKNHDLEKSTDSPKRLSLDQRIELELGVNLSSSSQGRTERYPPHSYPQFPDTHPNQYPNSYSCDSNSSGTQNFYPNSEFNGPYYNGHPPPPSHGQYPPYPPHAHAPPHPPRSGPPPSSVLQVGNIMEVVPTAAGPAIPPHAPVPPAKTTQVMQVGNVLQVVPNAKSVPPPISHPVQPHVQSPRQPQAYPNAHPPIAKATAVVPPSPILPATSPEAILNPLIKAIQMEKDKWKKAKEKRRAEREARRRARQARREARMMSVIEKLKKSVQYEGLTLGQEVEDDELLDTLPPSPIPVEIITVSTQDSLPTPVKGILLAEGFRPKAPNEKKEVKFADGVCPGDGTSTSGGEDRTSPSPKQKLPKEKRFKKKKTRMKKKVKVHIIRQVIQQEEDDDEDDDDLSPPPPPPGDPPPVFFARFPFGNAQYPVYQTQTTTTTLTTVQFPAQSFQ